jgi:hypothetical protein
LDYWHIVVLASVRLGCNLNYDRLQDLAKNHWTLRAIMGLGEWDGTRFSWTRIRDDVCLLQPETIRSINELIVGVGHHLMPEAVDDSGRFVRDGDQHSLPTESTLIRDGVRKITEACVALAEEYGLVGWRQHVHLQKQIKRTSRDIDRIATKKGPNYQQRLRRYGTLLQQSGRIVRRARALCEALRLAEATAVDVFARDSLQAYIARTERVQQTSLRRVIDGETVPNSEKLLSIYEPHTQLYKRGKAGEPIQFGRQVLIFEDAVGFITHYFLLPRDQGDKDVVVEQMRIVQEQLRGGIRRVSLDRGFHSPDNQRELAGIVPCVCLPKPDKQQAARQEATASVQFRQARQSHPGVESAIGALQSGNGLKRCRDRFERDFERYLALGILGRNLHTLGRLLIANEAPLSKAANTPTQLRQQSERTTAAVRAAGGAFFRAGVHKQAFALAGNTSSELPRVWPIASVACSHRRRRWARGPLTPPHTRCPTPRTAARSPASTLWPRGDAARSAVTLGEFCRSDRIPLPVRTGKLLLQDFTVSGIRRWLRDFLPLGTRVDLISPTLAHATKSPYPCWFSSSVGEQRMSCRRTRSARPHQWLPAAERTKSSLPTTTPVSARL